LKKPSVASSTAKPPDLLPFFLDANLGRHQIANQLRAAGETVILHDDHFPEGTKDEVWLSEIGKKGWIVLTKDDQIRYHRTEVESIKHSGARVIILPRGNMKAADLGTILVAALPRIRRFVKKTPPPFIGRLSPNGTVVAIKI
jgi:predicted nuclease of predicted toxin-antitoxin system